MPAVAAIAVSALFLALLSRGDPKRRRAARLDDEGHRPALRRLLALAAALPGLACALWAGGAAFVIWLGGCGVAGWLVTVWYGGRVAPRSSSPSSPRT